MAWKNLLGGEVFFSGLALAWLPAAGLVHAQQTTVTPGASKDHARTPAEETDGLAGVPAPGLKIKAIAAEGFIYGLPIVRNYAVMGACTSTATRGSSRRAPIRSRKKHASLCCRSRPSKKVVPR